MAVWLCRRWTGATLANLGPAFGRAGTDGVSNLVRRAEKRYQDSTTWQGTATKIETALGLNTEPSAEPINRQSGGSSCEHNGYAKVSKYTVLASGMRQLAGKPCAS